MMRNFLHFLALVSPFAFLVSCGAKVVFEDGPGGGESSGSNGSGAGDACSQFDDVATSTPVTFRIRNETGLDLYVPGICEAPSFSVFGPDPNITYQPQQPIIGGGCLGTCQYQRKDEEPQCGVCDLSSYLVPAGSTRDIVWPGLALDYVDITKSCFDSYVPDTQCAKIVEMPHGTCTLDIQGYSASEGLCDANGVCSGSATGIEAFIDPVQFSYPDADGIVDVVFELCAFGCAGR